MRHFLDFEKPIAALEGKVEELRHMSSDGSINIADEIGKLQTRIERELKTTYEKLGPWEKVQVARHPDRPRVSTIINQLFEDFTPLAGDRNYAEDYAVIGGMARFRGQAVMVMGTEKGSTTEERIKRNFGMARPEGYRKASRLMDLAGRFGLPVLSFVDTAGAYPGRGAEERGQAEAIASAIRSVRTCHLFGDLARGLRLDPVAQRRSCQGRRRGASHHIGAYEGTWRDRRHCPRAAGRRAS